MSVDFDCIVIGAGVVGPAITRSLALAGRDVLLVDAAGGIGTGVSSRNSEVIHGGLYYPAQSLKAQLCVQGKQMLYDYCVDRGIPHRRLGKLVVATDPEQTALLDSVATRARENGVTDIERLTSDEARALEPALHCTGALLSPSTGIVDSHAFMLAMQGDAERAGAQCVFHTPFLSGQVLEEGRYLLNFGGDDAISLTCRSVINAGGIESQSIAANMQGLPQRTVPPRYLCKGTYFSLQGRAPFSRLIYPVPQKDGLGIHLTLDMGDQAKFGPDTEWVPNEEYDVDPRRAQSFYSAIRTYWPDLPDDALLPAYTGIRPKISGPSEAASDFLIAGPQQHGLAGLVNLFGIESPGLTASLAIGEYVKQLIERP